MRVEKPRIFQSGRDIFLSLLVLVVIMAFVVAGTGMCQYHPGKPEPQTAVTIDAEQALQNQAATLSFPVRQPDVPEDWVANSARRVMYGNQPGVSVGWVNDDQWVAIIQTAAPEDAIVADMDDDKRELTGERTIEGKKWSVYSGVVGHEDARPLWIHDEGSVRFALSGIASERQLTTAAKAIQSAQPITVSDS